MTYTDNVRTGTWTYWNEQGKVTTVLQYSAGNIVALTDMDGRRQIIDKVIAAWKDAEAARKAEHQKKAQEAPGNDIFRVTEVLPTFQGDIQAYLAQNLQYPARAKAAGIEGKVVVQFIVERDGSIKEPKVLRSVNADLDSEALRLVRKMPRWSSGRNNGMPVRCYFTLPISFRLE